MLYRRKLSLLNFHLLKEATDEGLSGMREEEEYRSDADSIILNPYFFS